MKISTFNVNSIRSRKGLLLSWLEKRGHDLDILCLQELKGEGDTFPYQELEDVGFTCHVFGEKRYNGVAVCTKEELTHLSPFGDEEWDKQKRLIQGKIGDLRIINIYVPHGGPRDDEKYYYKMGWYKKFLSFLKEGFSPHEPLIIVGDFNVALSSQDVYDEERLHDIVGTMPEERQALQDLLDFGLVDTFSYLYPEKRAFTWWDYRGGAFWRDEGMRIDYILCTAPLLERLEEVEVDLWPRRRRKPTPSDHTPVIATFNL